MGRSIIEFKTSVTPSLNKIISKRWAEYNAKKKYLRQLSGYELLAHKKKRKASITVIRYGSRALDHDNCMGGLKPLIDSIKELGLIVDDSPKWLDLKVEQKKCKRGLEHCIVKIKEA